MHYLLLGEERVTKLEKVASILKKHNIDPEGPERCVYFASEDSPDEILTEAMTYPFFGSKKAVIVQEAERMPVPRVKEYFKSPSDATILIFLSEQNKGKFSKTVEKLFAKEGEVQMFWPMFEDRLERWADKQGRDSYGLQLPPGLGQMLVAQCGRNTQLIDNNLQTLANYFGTKPFELEDAGRVINERREVTVFELIDALFAGRVKECLLFYRQLVYEGSEFLQILAMLIRQIELLWRYQEQGASAPDLRRLGKLARQKLQRQAARWSDSALAEAYTVLAELDRIIKSEGRNLAGIEFEKRLLQVCRLGRSA